MAEEEDPLMELELAPGKKRLVRLSAYRREIEQYEARQRGRAKNLAAPNIDRVKVKYSFALDEPTEITSRAQHKDFMARHNLKEYEPSNDQRPRSYRKPETIRLAEQKKHKAAVAKIINEVDLREPGDRRWQPKNESALSDDPRVNTSGVSGVMMGETAKAVRERGGLTPDQQGALQHKVQLRG